MFNKIAFKYWPGIILIIVIIAFHSRLFFPQASLYVTPHFGRSDFVNFNIPIKITLKKSLSNFNLPLWEKNIGQGFPIFAEGQVGALYPPNILLFSLLPLWLAFNLSIIITFLTATFGTYLLSRSLNIGKTGSLFAALTYTFCPFMVLHIEHLNLIQASAIFPWQLLVVNLFFIKKEIRYLIFFAVITSLQIFAGFQQIVFYSLLGTSIFILFKIFEIRGSLMRAKIIASLGIFLVLAFAITFIQLSATFELFREAQRPQTTTLKSILNDFPFKPANLKTFVNPYIQGSPKNGTYPRFNFGSWGIFWENTAYFGIIQLVLIILFAPTFLFKKKKGASRQNFILFFSLGIIGVTLALGKETPFHILFSVPPFSLFRVPSRFLIFTFLSAALLTGLCLDKLITLKNKKIINFIVGAIILLAIFDIFRLWFNYHLTESIKKLETAPELRKYVQNDGRLLTYGIEEEWSEKYFVKEGWENNPDIYSFLRNSFAENSNLLYGVSQHAAYAGMSGKRSTITTVAASEYIISNENTLKIDNKSQNLLNANNVKYLSTTKNLKSDKWQLLQSISTYHTTINLYKNSEANERVYIPNGFKVATPFNDFRSILENGTDVSKIVVLEENIDLPETEAWNRGTAQITQDNDNLIKINADLKEKSLVTLSDSYYPGWKAYIDGQETKIYPTNINSRSVVVPAGHHSILYRYDSQTIKTGALITGIALILTLLLLSSPKIRNYRLNN